MGTQRISTYFQPIPWPADLLYHLFKVAVTTMSLYRHMKKKIIIKQYHKKRF